MLNFVTLSALHFPQAGTECDQKNFLGPWFLQWGKRDWNGCPTSPVIQGTAWQVQFFLASCGTLGIDRLDHLWKASRKRRGRMSLWWWTRILALAESPSSAPASMSNSGAKSARLTKLGTLQLIANTAPAGGCVVDATKLPIQNSKMSWWAKVFPCQNQPVK